jgi:hypothetical protein
MNVGERAVYRVTSFNEPNPSAADTAKVSWLIKSMDGAALAHFAETGPVLEVVVPDGWAGHTALAMPYSRSPSAAISVRTEYSAPASDRPAPSLERPRTFEVVQEDSRFYASADGEPRFFLGKRVKYGKRFGLMNTANPPGPRYDPLDYEADTQEWAWWLYPTILCESRGYFTCLNTYDRAAFTFGHIQLGAHTPDDNFVLLFRELLARPEAGAYFPDLVVTSGRIHLRTGGALETKDDTSALMAYFNPNAGEIDAVETQRAARMVDWCMRHPEARRAQVAFAVREQRKKLARHAKRLPLDGIVDKLCFVVLDILHQGRGNYAAIRTALAATDPLDALLSIGGASYGSRVATLRVAIKDLEVAGRMGNKVYSVASNDFVVPSGA